MKYQEIVNKSLSEIYDDLYNLKKELLSTRVQKVVGEVKNTSLVRKSRRDIARLKTRLTQMANKK